MVAYGSVGTGSGSSVASYPVTRPPSTAAGDVLVAFQFSDIGSVGALTLTGGTAWTTLASGGSQGFAKLYWKVAGPAEPANYTAAQDAGADGVTIIVRVVGGAAITPVFATIFTHGGNPVTTPSVTPSGANDLLIRFAMGGTFENANTWTPPADHTERADLTSTGRYASGAAATRQLTAGGATGTANFVASYAGIGKTVAATVAIADGTQYLAPPGIASAEAAGAPAVAMTVSPNALPSGEAFGTPIIATPTPQAVTAEGIGSAEAFGALATTLYLKALSVSSGEGFGSPRLAALIGPMGIPSGQAFGATNVAIEQFVTPAGVSSSEQFGSHTLRLGYPQTIAVVAVESGELVEDPTISNVARLVLVNPSIQETPAAWNALMSRFGLDRGITIMKDAEGVWRTARYPAQTELESAQRTYLGGRRHWLTVEEADELISAGFGAYITLEPSD